MSLAEQQSIRLGEMLRNELDFAYRRRVRWIIERLGVESAKRILDCGCGRGYYLNYIRGLTSEPLLVGVDTDSQVFAEADFPEGRQSLVLMLSQGESLPFREASLDCVVLSEVLEHVPDDRALLRELYRVLIPGGTLLITVPNRSFPFLLDPVNKTLGLIHRPIRKGFLSGIWANHERLYEVDDLCSLVRSVGFRIEEQDLISWACFPFQHNLLYDIGKELLLSGKLPRWAANAGDRARYDKNSGAWWNPVNMLRSLLGAVDRLNDAFPARHSSVCIALNLRKPDC